MLYPKFGLFILLFSFKAITAIAQFQSCGCEAALRYDIYKLNKDSLSEILLAKEINSTNFREIEQRAGGGLIIFGIPIGANGENIDRIKQTYSEKMNSSSTARMVSQYESVTTSSISYSVYQDCMQRCIAAGQKGLDGYVIKENSSFTEIELSYKEENRAKPIKVSYTLPTNKEVLVTIKPNEFKTIRINRSDSNAFSMTFNSGSNRAVSVPIKAFAPITAIMNVSFDNVYPIQGASKYYSVVTQNNNNVGCGIVGSLLAGERDKTITVQNLSGRPDGGSGEFPDCTNSRQFSATRVIFKASSTDGWLLKNPNVECVADGGICAFREDAKFLRNDANMVIYTEKTFSAPVTINFRVETYKIITTQGNFPSLTTNKYISFEVPTTAQNAVIHYNGLALPLGQSNENLQLMVSPSTAGSTLVYNYTIKSFIK